MTMIVVLFNLKDVTKRAEYEQWAKETDLPTASSLPSVDSFEVLRTTGLLGGDAEPPYQYVELLKINDMEQLGKDVAGELMQQVSSEFQSFADTPLFVLTQKL